ncbi:MAG TPA: hypoxanthine-guanine phosphoribosyltransferase [Rudaea sp.]|jgi:hypoxanthine phosphoribosyltransferase|nr:hypoxanthine-guanine phosphoribosyltransferase [Rudaea sp.]
MTRPALAEALKDADLLHDRAKLETSIARMGHAIDAALAGEVPLYLSVMHGGLIFSGALALAVATDLEFDYVHATRYRGATQGGELHWLRKPATSPAGRTVLLADDILDEGYTLRAIRDWCIDQGARRVLIAVMCQKRHDRTAPGVRADFCGVEVPDRYVFGFGMDFHEQGRNLPAIYALKE